MFVIVTESGFLGEGPWSRKRDAVNFLAAEVSYPAVVVELPNVGLRRIRDTVVAAGLWVNANRPSPEDGLVFDPEWI